MNDNSNRLSRITVRFNEKEMIKLEELSKKSNMGNADFIRNLIMTADSNSKDKLSIEILQRIYVLLQINTKIIDKIIPGKVTQEWMDGLIAKSKKRYPTD